jgi:cyclophilin family peptidyl-prolyl cis-trans isomerase
MKQRLPLIGFVCVLLASLGFGYWFLQVRSATQAEVAAVRAQNEAAANPEASPTVSSGPAPITTPLVNNPNPDWTIDSTTGLSYATAVLVTSKGVIRFKFYPKDAPETVKRIAELVSKDFYKDLVFHRVISGFVAQTGDPTGTGSGGSGTNLKAEFNSRKHVDGTVAMARAEAVDSADSQFYITLGTQPHLDGKYTVFGQVTEGMDIARSLTQGDRLNQFVIQ